MRFLVEKNNIQNSEIQKIFIYQPARFAENFTAFPPATSVDTASSLRYLVGAFLFYREIGPKWYEDHKKLLKNRDFQELVKKIEILKDEGLQANFDEEKTVKGKVILETTDAHFEKEMRLEELKGNPRNNPMSMEEIREKFFNLSERTIGACRAQKFLELMDQDDYTMNIKDIVKLLTLE